MPTLTLHYKEDPSAGPIPAEIHYSSTTTTAPKPIILIFHAGGFAAGSTALIPRTQIKYLTETLDTIVVAPAYRLCPQVSLREGPLADARDCLAWARTELAAALRREGVPVVADAERIGVMGHSAGGMLALELVSECFPLPFPFPFIYSVGINSRTIRKKILTEATRATNRTLPPPSSISTASST